MKGIVIDFKLDDQLKRIFLPSHIAITFSRTDDWEMSKNFLKDLYGDKKVILQSVQFTERLNLTEVTHLERKK